MLFEMMFVGVISLWFVAVTAVAEAVLFCSRRGVCGKADSKEV